MTPKTWTDAEIVEEMVEAVREYRSQCEACSQRTTLQDQCEAVLVALKQIYIIEHTP